MLERLTTRHDGVAVIKDKCKIKEAMEKLAKYEEQEEQGMLFVVPAKIGDSIWDNDFGIPHKYTITGFSHGNIGADNDNCSDESFVYFDDFRGIAGRVPVSEVGKTVYLTRAEAREKLRMEGMR